MMSYPHTVLLKGLAKHVNSPVRVRLGGGAAHVSRMRSTAASARARARVQSKHGAQGYGA